MEPESSSPCSQKHVNWAYDNKRNSHLDNSSLKKTCLLRSVTVSYWPRSWIHTSSTGCTFSRDHVRCNIIGAEFDVTIIVRDVNCDLLGCEAV
jgi:hypothetical protein